MFSSKFIALFAIALVFASANAAPAEEVEIELHDDEFDEEVERGIKTFLTEVAKEAAKKLIDEAKKYLIKEAKKVNLECVKEIYDHCDVNPLKHPKKYYKCAKNYFVEHKAHCYKNGDKVEDQTEASDVTTIETEDVVAEGS